MTAADALALLVDACPSYRHADALDAYVQHFEEDGHEDPYVRAGALAHHLADLVATRDVEEVGRVFAVVEELLGGPDPEARELAAIGVLEPLANIASHDDVPVSPADVRSLLGTLAVAVWDENQQLWEDAARWRSERPLVTVDDYDGVADVNLRRYLQAHKRRLAGGALFGVADVVRFQDDVAAISAVTPAGRPRVPWPVFAVIGLLVLAIVVALAR